MSYLTPQKKQKITSQQWLDIHGLDKEVSLAYGEKLAEHLEYVRQAGERLGLSKSQLHAHDASKWSQYEYGPYARYFNGPRDEKDGEEFGRAFLHHIHNNRHHWQYWMLPNGFAFPGSKSENGVFSMPSDYVAEMVADWIGAGMAYTQSPDITAWADNNLPNRVTLHTKSWRTLDSILKAIGYSDTSKWMPAGLYL